MEAEKTEKTWLDVGRGESDEITEIKHGMNLAIVRDLETPGKFWFGGRMFEIRLLPKE